MNIVCLDMEGVLVPEIWIEFSKKTGIPELTRTTRDEPDYDKLMHWRIGILREHGLGLKEIQDVIASIDPLPGAKEFLDELRKDMQVIIISDTFTQFAMPLMAKLGYPALFCNSLIVGEDGMIEDFKMRITDSKLSTVRALQSIGFETIASGDSYNDLDMIKASKAGDVVHAIQESCNTFFYEVGRNLGITKMNEYRVMFGLGEKTGCELSEAKGVLDSPEYRASLGQTWLPGYTVQSAIGQAGNLFSIIQLANYCATIANGGTRYKTHFIKSVMKYDNSGIVLENKPEVMCRSGISDATLNIVREGMHRVCSVGYCRTYFTGLKVKVDPAAKTGTSQEYRIIHGKSTKINNGFFISFAPYDEPQIAVAVIGEGMTSGAYVAPVAADIYEYYFSKGEEPAEAQGENTLIG